MLKKSSEGFCEMCGYYVQVRQKAHIVAEGKKNKDNLLMLCPTCHIMFDTYLKSKIYRSLKQAGINNLPVSWEKSIYLQAAEASMLQKKSKSR